ncbi:MAG TPA: hypothetical protein PLD48_00195 [Bacillota bacterium]|nr:hypothetical protein [Bacillota bacterium]HOK69567.1 hypothetical protein [Bacillota bacterium]
MERRSIFDIISTRQLDTHEEFYRLHTLFSIEQPINYNSLEVFINKYVFRYIPLSDTFLDVKDIRKYLKIEITDCNYSLNDLLLFCELLINIFNQGESIIKKVDSAYNQVKIIKRNIELILSKTGHELRKINNNQWIIAEINTQAFLAAEMVDNETAALNIIEYNHFQIKGDIEKKRSILLAIANLIEPILKDKILGNNGFKQLESDASFLINCFHIRHNNLDGPKQQEYLIGLDEKQLEDWYDKTYELLLLVIITNNYIKNIKAKIEDVKAKYRWVN